MCYAKWNLSRFWVTVHTAWEVQIVMASIEEGGVIFQIPQKGTVTVDHFHFGDMKLGDLPENIADGMSERLETSMSSTLNSMEDQLIYALANANRLCLPAAGTFFMKDPIFNQRGDLLVTLAYDGYFFHFALFPTISNTSNRAEPPLPPPKGKYRLGRG